MKIEVKEQLLILIELEPMFRKMGHHLLFDYHAHIDDISWRLYEGGWSTKTKPTKSGFNYQSVGKLLMEYKTQKVVDVTA